MPEGPEVRTVVDKLYPYLINNHIVSLITGDRAKITGTILTFPVIINKLYSYGKKIIIELNNNQIIIISLGMTGRLQYNEGRHSHIKFNISDSKNIFSLFFDDQRYMGKIQILSDLTGLKLGPDLLQSSLTTWISKEQWLNIFSKRFRRAIYNVLTDQELVCGIGWYLMTEILYFSGIHPERKANTINDEEWDRIRIISHKLIYIAYSYHGLTIENFISPDGTLGTYPAVIYGKSHDPLGHKIIDKSVNSNRTIHFVPELQL